MHMHACSCTCMHMHARACMCMHMHAYIPKMYMIRKFKDTIVTLHMNSPCNKRFFSQTYFDCTLGLFLTWFEIYILHKKGKLLWKQNHSNTHGIFYKIHDCASKIKFFSSSELEGLCFSIAGEALTKWTKSANEISSKGFRKRVRNTDELSVILLSFICGLAVPNFCCARP